jgi:hypothetical protein
VAMCGRTAATGFGELASPQEGLRRVAKLVARGAPPSEVFAAVAEEMAGWLHIGNAAVTRIDDGTLVVLALGRFDPRLEATLARQRSLDGDGLAARVVRTGRPARMDYHNAAGAHAQEMRRSGFYSAAGAR